MIRLATIGSGKIVDTFLDAVSQVEGIVLTAVYSRTESRAAEFAAAHGISQYYWDMEQMLADSEIDCVYLAVPNSLHFPYAKKALLAGKHVICEKPFVTEKKEAEELFGISEAQGVFLMEAITVLHMPNYQILKEWMAEIGRVRMINYEFCHYSHAYDDYLAGKNPNIFNPDLAGGALMDMNVYNIHPVADLFGVPKQAFYFANRGENGADTSGTAVLRYDDFQAVCMSAKDCNGGTEGTISGELGYIKVVGGGNICGRLELYLNSDETRLAEYDGSKNRMIYEVQDFVQMTEGKDRKAYEKWKAETLDVMEILDLLRK